MTGPQRGTGAEPPWTILPATPVHARALAACNIACWREAYRGLVPDHLLDAFDVDRGAASWARSTRRDGSILIARVGAEVVGFTRYGPPQEHPAVAERELAAMYVRARWYGTGLAHALLGAVLEPGLSCSLWVFDRNPRARAFYAKYGFAPDGTERSERFGAATEIRMVRPAVMSGP
ncbi:N-acetyltransferase family protein [Nocardia sp. NPDC003345]